MRAKPASRVRIPPSPPTRCETPAAQVAGVFAFRAGMLGPMWPTVGRMYTPKHFDLPDLSHARLMIQEHPLATLMLIDPTHGLSATPVPMIWGAPSEASSSATGQASTGEGWWLEGHLARPRGRGQFDRRLHDLRLQRRRRPRDVLLLRCPR